MQSPINAWKVSTKKASLNPCQTVPSTCENLHNEGKMWSTLLVGCQKCISECCSALKRACAAEFPKQVSRPVHLLVLQGLLLS